MEMKKRQVDMETLRRDCKREFDSEFGGGRAGNCPQCGTYVNANLADILWTFTWRWVSYGSSQLSGARYGRGPPKNVWTTFV